MTAVAIQGEPSGADAASSLSAAAASQLPEWPDDLLDRLGAELLDDLAGGTVALVMLSCTCRRLRSFFADPSWAARRGEERGVPGVCNLEALAVLEVVTGLGTNRIFFRDAQPVFRKGSTLARLDEFAVLLRRHPRLTVHIEGHTGSSAPDVAAVPFSRERAQAVAQALLERELLVHAPDARRARVWSASMPTARFADRITCRGWGKEIAVAAGWSAGLDSRHAEVFFRLDSAELPPRPAHYGRGEGARGGACTSPVGQPPVALVQALDLCSVSSGWQ